MQDEDYTRYLLKFEVLYSYNFEKMMYKLFARADKLCSFVLLFCATTVIASWGNSIFFGFVIAFCTCIQFVYSPNAKSYAAKECFHEYSKILRAFDDLSTEEIKQQLGLISKQSTDEIGWLSHPARLAALAQLGHSNKTLEDGFKEKQMSFAEKLFSILAGEPVVFDFDDKQK